MEDKSKLFVFDKKEVALIFLFMIIISVISFTLGFRMGKKVSYEAAGMTNLERELVDIKSVQEEEASQIFKEEVGSEKGKTDNNLQNSSKEGLKEEFDELREEGYPQGKKVDMESVQAKPVKKEGPVVAKQELSQLVVTPVEKKSAVDDLIVKEGNEKQEYVGKYTIQLGSHQGLDEAKEFADGFTIRGYNPIINEVHIKDRGTWYRVSLGVFDSVASAKEYIKEEESLFQGSNYVITELK